MFNPFSSNEVEPKIEVKEEDGSSWYDFLNPFSYNSDLKKETISHEA